jgi:hypothetical protein
VLHALITINNVCYFQRMLDLARRLEQHGGFRARLYLHGFRELETRHREICRAAGIEVVGATPQRRYGPLARLATLTEAASTLSLMRAIRGAIRTHAIDIVIMPEDSPDYGGPAITKAAHAEDVPVAVLATLGSAPLDELASIYMYFDELAGGGMRQRLVGRLFPEWQRRHHGKAILRSPVERILVQKALRIAAAKPWVYYSGHADAILVDSDEVREFCVTHGLDASRVRVTGFVEHDALFAGMQNRSAVRAQLDAELGLDPLRPILLLALVQEHYIQGAPKCDFQNHADMVAFIVKTVATTNLNVVVSLHPSMSYDAFKYIEAWGPKISRWETVKLVPVCDTFVASGSSTINWAVACGKPVINYDVYRYGLSAFANVPAVMTVQEQADFIARVQRVDDPAALRELTAKQVEAAKRWGRVDGNAFERIRSTLVSLAGAA